MNRFIKFLFAIAIPHGVHAGGFSLNSQGVKGYAMAGAMTGLSLDASAAYYNAGALGFLDKNNIILGAFGSYSKTAFLSRFDGNQFTDNPMLARAHVYAACKVNDKISAGLSFNDPFGFHKRWKDDWEGRFVTLESKLTVHSLQPVISYAVNEYFGIGAGFNYMFGSWSDRFALPTGNPESRMQLNTDGSGSGFHLGLFIKSNSDFQGGLVFRSPVKFKLKDGSFASSSVPQSFAADIAGSGNFSGEIHLPAAISAAVTYSFTKELIATVQLDYQRWSSFDSLSLISDNTMFQYKQGLKLSSVLSGRAAVQYNFTDAFTVRGGFAYELSPYRNEHLLPQYPDANKVVFGVGSSHVINDHFSADLAFSLENYFEREGSDSASELSGSYNSVKYSIGIGINYSF